MPIHRKTYKGLGRKRYKMHNQNYCKGHYLRWSMPLGRKNGMRLDRKNYKGLNQLNYKFLDHMIYMDNFHLYLRISLGRKNCIFLGLNKCKAPNPSEYIALNQLNYKFLGRKNGIALHRKNGMRLDRKNYKALNQLNYKFLGRNNCKGLHQNPYKGRYLHYCIFHYQDESKLPHHKSYKFLDHMIYMDNIHLYLRISLDRKPNKFLDRNNYTVLSLLRSIFLHRKSYRVPRLYPRKYISLDRKQYKVPELYLHKCIFLDRKNCMRLGRMFRNRGIGRKNCIFLGLNKCKAPNPSEYIALNLLNCKLLGHKIGKGHYLHLCKAQVLYLHKNISLHHRKNKAPDRNCYMGQHQVICINPDRIPNTEQKGLPSWHRK